MNCTNVQGGRFRGYLDGYAKRRPAADGITADVVITELNRRDVPVVRFNPAGIGEDLAVSAGDSLRDGVGDTSRAAPP